MFDGADGIFLPVGRDHYRSHLGWSRWFYGGDDFPCLQLVWPDAEGLFPWRPGAKWSRELQPDLTAMGWAAEVAADGA